MHSFKKAFTKLGTENIEIKITVSTIMEPQYSVNTVCKVF